MENKKIYSMLSLCAKSGRLVSGGFSVEKAVKNQSAYLVLVAQDASNNTKKLFNQKCNYYKIPYFEFGDKDSLGKFIGKEMRTSVAVLDKGFANQIVNYMNVKENVEV